MSEELEVWTHCPLCDERVERWEGTGPWIHSESESIWCLDGRRGCDAIEEW